MKPYSGHRFPRRRSTRACLAVVACVGLALAAGTEIRGAEGTGDVRIEGVVRQLGSVTYAVREAAERQLEAIGPEALPALRAAVAGNDLEIRFRAERLIGTIERDRQRRLLKDFLTDYDPELSQQLAGWPRFSALVGDDLEARRLFVEMSDAEPELMTLSGTAAATLPYVLEARALEMRPQSGQRPTSLAVPAASTAALLFVSLDPASTPSATTRTVISSLVGESAFWRAVSASQDPAIRRLLAAWVREASDVAAATRMSVGMKFQLPDAVEPALELIRSQVHGSQLQYAVFAVARLGSAEHVPVLEKLLNDATVLSERQRGDEETFTCQVRDVALAALIHLVGKQPRDFGFTELRPNSNSLYALNTAGFDSDEARAAAFRQWQLWKRLQRHDERHVEENAVEGVGL